MHVLRFCLELGQVAHSHSGKLFLGSNACVLCLIVNKLRCDHVTWTEIGSRINVVARKSVRLGPCMFPVRLGSTYFLKYTDIRPKRCTYGIHRYGGKEIFRPV